MRNLALTICLLTLPFAAAADSRFSEAEAALLQEGLIETADGFVLPAYRAQAEAAETLHTALGAYCHEGAGMEPVHDAFAETFLAWQRSSIVQVGPVMHAEGPMRVQLWPDAKDFSVRAIRAALREEDPALLAPGGLKGRSIALTNLTALEALLADPLPAGGYGCDLATAIAAFQADLAAGLVEDWTPGSAFRTAFDTASTGNDRYASIDGLIRELLAGAVVYVDRLRKFKILRGLGEAPGEARAVRTEAWQSDLGLPSLVASFDGLSEFYDLPYGLFDAAPELGGSMAYLTLAESAGSVAARLALSEGSLRTIAEEDGDEAAALRGFADQVLGHERFLKSGFLSSIGLSTGFTSADGD